METKIQQPSADGIGSNGFPGMSIMVIGSGSGWLHALEFAGAGFTRDCE
jgi:hypothetical protein